jgi:hypothetical protein
MLKNVGSAGWHLYFTCLLFYFCDRNTVCVDVIVCKALKREATHFSEMLVTMYPVKHHWYILELFPSSLSIKHTTKHFESKLLVKCYVLYTVIMEKVIIYISNVLHVSPLSKIEMVYDRTCQKTVILVFTATKPCTLWFMLLHHHTS